MNGIGLREAAEKYHVPRSTLAHWISAGLIRKVQEAEKRGEALLLMEVDIVALLPQKKAAPAAAAGLASTILQPRHNTPLA